MSGWQSVGCDSAACPEVSIGATDVLVRSSDHRDAVAVLTHAEWRQLCEAIKRGELAVGG